MWRALNDKRHIYLCAIVIVTYLSFVSSSYLYAPVQSHQLTDPSATSLVIGLARVTR